MGKIKVYLQYPWKFPDSPYYKYLIEYPPKSVEYINVEKQKGAITKKRKFFFSNFLKKIRHYAHELRLPFPNMHLTKKGDYNLIHCAHCLSRNKDTPWVADFESYWQFWLSGRSTKLGRKLVKRVLLEKNLKKMLIWTEIGKKEILEMFPMARKKLEVVYPAVPLHRFKKKNRGIGLLFIGRYFYGKGGMHALEAMDIITKKRKNVVGYFISSVPKDILEKYVGNKKIRFYDIMPQERLINEIFPTSDIFIYPGYSDTFGFSMLEAMSFGIPVITVEGYAKDEIIDNEKTGFIVSAGNKSYKENIKNYNKEVIEGVVKKTLKLIDDEELRKKMAKNCTKTIKNGKFSIKERNKKLKKIYEDALA